VEINMAVCLPRDAETVPLVRSAIAQTLRVFGADEDCVYEVSLAVSEACTNVVTHASGDDEYEVVIHVNESRCSIDVKDTGAGFDSSSLTDAMPSPDSARGRGVAIMRAVMDNVDLTSSPEAGTIVHLVRNLTVRKDSPLLRLR
jgi:serine/threonine-protein kinase RsbW